MLKNMKLATKITLGFTALIIVASVLGILGWISVRGMTDNFSKSDAGNACLLAINNTGNMRRDFAIYGFTAKKGETSNAAEKWEETYNDFTQKLSTLLSLKGLKQVYREKAAAAQKKGEQYKEAFQQQKDAQTVKSNAFTEWGKIGREVTEYFSHLDNSKIGSLREDFVEPFLLLRVAAVYLLATDGEEQWQSFSAQIEKVKSSLEDWHENTTQDKFTSEIYSKLNAFVERYTIAGNQYWGAVVQKNRSDELMAAQASAVVETITSIRQGIESDMAAMSTNTNIMVIVTTLIAIIIGALLSFFITRSIVRPINNVIVSMSSGSEQVAAASEQLSSTSQQMSEGASEQASSLEEISSSLEEMSSMTKQNAGNSRQATSMANDASKAAVLGIEKMERMSVTINRIKTSSDETAKIVKTIDEIAMQTNLLALNAAVEAARAGEAGRGFAVVAEEVRNLAQRSADAAKNTADLIAESQKNAEDGVGASRDVNEILEQIADKVKKVDLLIAEVSAASDEQSSGVDQINTAIAQMDSVTQQNAANSEESASASEELSSQAQQLNAMVEELTRIVRGSDGRNHTNHYRAKGSGTIANIDKRTNTFHAPIRRVTPSSHNKHSSSIQNPHDNHLSLTREHTHEITPADMIKFDDEPTLKEF
ncbi:MAG: hypothetical protein JW863_15985 [Chitinispirillaceae bacterium]|nr:hypothetical protein [Chitinispirillaceae bacterium]